LFFKLFTGADSKHIQEDQLESYAIGEHTPEVEQHLLVCDACRGRVYETDAISRAMKKAVPMLPAEPERSRWGWRILVPAFAASAVLLIAVAVDPLAADRSPVVVALFAMRGSATEARGPAGRPLLLRPDLSGLAEALGYDIDVVDSTGARVWRGVVNPNGGTATVAVPAQSKGVYFVRISLSGELLREYALVLARGNSPSS
jgi:hypothetical protein